MLFQLSVLWRCGVSRRPEFKETQLGPHADKIRRMLVEGDPGNSHEYGCIVVLPSLLQITRRLVYPPEPVTCEGHRCYRASMGGLWWIYVVSAHSAAFPHRDLFLSETGVLQVMKEGRHATQFLINLGQHLNM